MNSLIPASAENTTPATRNDTNTISCLCSFQGAPPDTPVRRPGPGESAARGGEGVVFGFGEELGAEPRLRPPRHLVRHQRRHLLRHLHAAQPNHRHLLRGAFKPSFINKGESSKL